MLLSHPKAGGEGSGAFLPRGSKDGILAKELGDFVPAQPSVSVFEKKFYE